MSETSKLLFIFNPYSGKANVKNHLFEIVDSFTKAGNLVTVYPTQKPNDCREYVAEHALEYESIIVSGGDGTLNEAVAGLFDCEGKYGKPTTETKIGYIPSGSTNDFASSLRIPKSISGAIKTAVEGTAHSFDVGLFNGRPYNYVAAFGLFTKVSYATPQELKNALGHQAYILESILSLTELKSYTITVKNGDEEYTETYVYGMVANSVQVGGVKNLSGKDIRLDDGLFEVLLVKEAKNPLQMQQIVNGLIMHEENQMVRHFKTNNISFVSDEPVAWVLDGEFGGDVCEAKIEVVANKINYILK